MYEYIVSYRYEYKVSYSWYYTKAADILVALGNKAGGLTQRKMFIS